MTEQSYFQLISPLIFIVFAVGFLVLYRLEKRLVSAKIFALSYAVGAVAMTLDFFRNQLSMIGLEHLSNYFYMATAVVFSGALLTSRTGKGHWKTLGVLFLISASMSLWYTLVDPDITMRVYLISFMGTILFGYPVVYLWKRQGLPIDRLILTLTGISAILLTLRALVVLWYEGATLTDANYAQSVTAISLQFTSSVCAVVIAMALLVRFGMDIVIRLRNSSETDALTDITNRRGMEIRLPEFVEGLESGVGAHAVALIDLDDFKAVNDTYGHIAGDAVLRAISQELRALPLGRSFVARMGGEEFAYFFYNTNVSAAKLACEQTRIAAEGLRHSSAGGKPITLSFGIALWEQGQTISDVLRRADGALYAAKEAGKNTVVIDGENVEPDKVPHSKAS